MPPRPVLKMKQNRPVSAIYLGKGASPSLQDLSHSASTYSSLINGTPPNLPDLPEPPSPSSSKGSVKSGLPSPPATNSTGSGSTGDPATIRERPVSYHSNSSSSESYQQGAVTPMRRSSSSHGTPSRSNSRQDLARMDDVGVEGDFDDDYDKENDNDNESNIDGDDTARLDRKFLTNNFGDGHGRSSSENVLALQRVKNLAQRNRMALDKLSRLSPSPARAGTPNSRSPAPSSSSRLANPPRESRRSTEIHVHDLARSGSETERESTRHSSSSHSSSSHIRSASSSHHSPALSSSRRLSTSPPPPSTPHHQGPYHRVRQISAPTSPEKVRLGTHSEASASTSRLVYSPPSRRRNRLSLASVSQLQLSDQEEEEGEEPSQKIAIGTTRRNDRTLSERDMIIQSALAAAASSRRSPLSARRRGALPKEFRSDQVEDNATFNSTGSANRHARRESWRNMEPITPFRPTSNINGVNRSATLREPRRASVQDPRWSSDDLRTSATVRDRAYNTSNSPEDGSKLRAERRQSLRAGSAESALIWSPGGSRLVGEGLRAAGLRPKREDENRGGLNNAGAPSASDRRVDWSPQDILDDGRRRISSEREREKQPVRASTSMAQYAYLDRDEDDSHRRELRNHRSSHHLTTKDLEQPQKRELSLSRRERESIISDRAASALGTYQTPAVTSPTPLHTTSVHQLDRMATSSPFATRQYNSTTQPPAILTASQAQLEHTRLMLESLSMFETQISKLPQLATSTNNASTGASQVELARNAQGVVFAAERLSGMLRHGSTQAMEAQIEAEVESGPSELTEILGKVGTEYRDGSRVADELVRGITALLLGVGRVMRDFSLTSSEFGSPNVHGRHHSVEDERRVSTPDLGARINGPPIAETGRHSVASRRSWEPAPKDREREREETFRRLAGNSMAGVRPESVLARASPATFQRLKDREEREREQARTPASATKATGSSGATGSIRRLFTPREKREHLLDHERERERDSKVDVIRGGANLVALDSQETIHQREVEPSPTPASRVRASPRERSRTLTPLTISRPLPTLPSESATTGGAIKRQLSSSAASSSFDKSTGSTRDRTRSTMRSSFPLLTSPSNATTAVTTHTVSNTPNRPLFPLPRTDSDKSLTGSGQVTFSKPTTGSTAALTDLAYQVERQRSGSSSDPYYASHSESLTSSMSSEKSAAGPVSAARRTLGTRAGRASLDSQVSGRRSSKEEEEDRERNRLASSTISRKDPTVHAADRSAATILQQSTGSTRERRRTVTDIWPQK